MILNLSDIFMIGIYELKPFAGSRIAMHQLHQSRISRVVYISS